MCVSPYNYDNQFIVQIQELPLNIKTQFIHDVNYVNSHEFCKSTVLKFDDTFKGFWFDVDFGNVINDNRIVNNPNDTINYFVHDGEAFNVTDLPNNTLCLIFESLEFLNRNSENNFTFFSQSDRYIDKSNSYVQLFSNMLSFYPGEAFFMDFEPHIYKDVVDNYRLELGQQLSRLPFNLAPNKIGFGIYSRSQTYRSEELEMYNSK